MVKTLGWDPKGRGFESRGWREINKLIIDNSEEGGRELMEIREMAEAECLALDYLRMN